MSVAQVTCGMCDSPNVTSNAGKLNLGHRWCNDCGARAGWCFNHERWEWEPPSV